MAFRLCMAVLLSSSLAAYGHGAGPQYSIDVKSEADYTITGFNQTGTGSSFQGTVISSPGGPGVGTVNYANNFTSSPTYNDVSSGTYGQKLTSDVFLLTDGQAADNSTQGNAFPVGSYLFVAPSNTSLLATFMVHLTYSVTFRRINAAALPNSEYDLDIGVNPYVNSPSNLAINFDVPISGAFNYADGTVISGSKDLSGVVFVPANGSYVLVPTNKSAFSANIPAPVPEPAPLAAMPFALMAFVKGRRRQRE